MGPPRGERLPSPSYKYGRLTEKGTTNQKRQQNNNARTTPNTHETNKSKTDPWSEKDMTEENLHRETTTTGTMTREEHTSRSGAKRRTTRRGTKGANRMHEKRPRTRRKQRQQAL